MPESIWARPDPLDGPAPEETPEGASSEAPQGSSITLGNLQGGPGLTIADHREYLIGIFTAALDSLIDSQQSGAQGVQSTVLGLDLRMAFHMWNNRRAYHFTVVRQPRINLNLPYDPDPNLGLGVLDNDGDTDVRG